MKILSVLIALAIAITEQSAINSPEVIKTAEEYNAAQEVQDDRKTLYLTFDDGPSKVNTPKVLDILKERNIKATFFVVGASAEKNPDILLRIAEEGHTIGIHSYSHDFRSIYKSTDAFIADFNKAREVIFDITGQSPIIYRFPGGSKNSYNKGTYKAIIAEMNKRGFIYYDWNMSVQDARKGVKTGDLFRSVKEGPKPENAILLAHDAYSYITVELNNILDYLEPDYKTDVITPVTPPAQFK